jgi:hypothetical protein
VTFFSFINSHNYLKLKKNWYEIHLILNQKCDSKKFGAALKHYKSTLVPKKRTKTPTGPRCREYHTVSLVGRRKQMVRILRQNAIHFLQSLFTQQPYAYWFSSLCVWVCVCECVISMDHGTSCYEVFLPLSLTCCFLQDVSPNTANSNSPLSPSCICSPVLSQIISWCRAPELNRKGVFVVLSYWRTRCINFFF